MTGLQLVRLPHNTNRFPFRPFPADSRVCFMMKKNLFRCLFAFFVLFSPFSLLHATPGLQERINAIVQGQSADIGVAIESGSGQGASFQADKAFPMQSVVKFPLALAVLDAVDKGRWHLDDTFLLTGRELLPDTHSPLREKYADGPAQVTLREILTDTVSHSDNNGCDMLFRLLGGPEAVERYVKGLGIEGFRIRATEEEMQRSWDAQFANTATPAAANRLLRLFQQKKLLSASSHELLWAMMRDSMTGPGRLREPLPAGAVLVHKTGTGDTSPVKGTTVNDIGIILLPDGRPVFISVFITHAPDSIMDTEKTIASLSQAAWEYYSALPRNPLAAAQHGVRELFRLND